MTNLCGVHSPREWVGTSPAKAYPARVRTLFPLFVQPSDGIAVLLEEIALPVEVD